GLSIRHYAHQDSERLVGDAQFHEFRVGASRNAPTLIRTSNSRTRCSSRGCFVRGRLGRIASGYEQSHVDVFDAARDWMRTAAQMLVWLGLKARFGSAPSARPTASRSSAMTLR